MEYMVLLWAVQSTESLWNVPREEETANREWKIYFKPSLWYSCKMMPWYWHCLGENWSPCTYTSMAIFVESDFPSSTLGFAMFNALPGKLFSNQLRKHLFWMVLISSTSWLHPYLLHAVIKIRTRGALWHYWDQSFYGTVKKQKLMLSDTKLVWEESLEKLWMCNEKWWLLFPEHLLYCQHSTVQIHCLIWLAQWVQE